MRNVHALHTYARKLFLCMKNCCIHTKKSFCMYVVSAMMMPNELVKLFDN